MGFLDKAREAAENALDKAGPALEKAKEKAGPAFEKAKEKAGPALDKAAAQVDKATGGKYHDQIDGVKGKAQDALGTHAPPAPGSGTHGGGVSAVPPSPPGGDTPSPQDGRPADTTSSSNEGPSAVPPPPPGGDKPSNQDPKPGSASGPDQPPAVPPPA
ncbi:MAG: Rv0909 family putative TA system antitoxin [Actinomycetota bacterium]|nr:Rv0909 family putative TA system antitoxin [Actinomycetota bacterium]